MDGLGDVLEALQGEVPFASFQSAHVGAVDADDLGEGFLGQATLQAVEPQVGAYDALEITFHNTPRFRGAT